MGEEKDIELSLGIGIMIDHNSIDFFRIDIYLVSVFHLQEEYGSCTLLYLGSCSYGKQTASLLWYGIP